MKKLLNRLIQAGVSVDTDPEHAKRIRLCNLIALTILVIIWPYMALFYILGFEALALMLIPVAALFCPVFYFNKMGEADFSRIMIVILMNGVVAAYSSFFGIESGVHLLYLVFIGIPFLIFGLHELKYLLVSLLIPTVLFFFIQFLYDDSILLASRSSQEVIYIGMLILVVGWTAANYFYLSYASKKKEEIISRKEKKFRDLLNQAPEAMVICNSDGVIQMINTRLEELFGYSSAETVGLTVNCLAPNNYAFSDVESWKEYFSLTLESTKIENIEQTFTRYDGTSFQAEMSTRQLVTDMGIMFSTFIRDITERKQIIELEMEALQAEVKNRDLEQFAYLLTHDLKSPLATIQGLLRLVKMDVKDEFQVLEYVDLMAGTAERMSKLIIDLLEYAVTGKERELSEVDCMEVVQNIQKDLSTMISQAQCTLQIGQLPTVYVNRTSVRMIFQNLINNAIKFSKKDQKPVLDIGSERQNGYWKFYVKDNGIGIAGDQADGIFKIFGRLHDDKYEGTGIGLAHCKKIVDQHGGEIWVESEPNKGSTFYFTLPAEISNSEMLQNDLSLDERKTKEPHRRDLV